MEQIIIMHPLIMHFYYVWLYFINIKEKSKVTDHLDIGSSTLFVGSQIAI
jgi:hypothetical protein